ncbi:glycosyltransferase family 4 protein [Thomasclavelia spiroformis]|uniref:glycosyltransferase family 4 protein n=1 Tax=Thomasclavelia spiroformis TaxID=29348 RepID=UPI000B39C11E|nr:glycosyltransferase family 4 protein [Thomasclavelia spiroformis]OUO70296.1 glycosyltransferase family 1 protein [Thomasclavelia spiroformis]
MKKLCICTTISLTMKTFVLETAKYLHEKEGYDITLICNNDKDFKESLPSYIHFIPVSMSRGIDFSAIKSILSFIKIFKREEFDLVQYSTPNASFYASIAARICRVPIRLYCQWGIRYIGFEGIKRTIFKIIEKSVCNNSTDIRAVSNMNMQFGIDQGLYSKMKVGIIGIGGTIGVDLDEYPYELKIEMKQKTRGEFNINSDLVFGFAGRLSKDKGGNELLKSMKKLEKEGFDASLLIVGPNESDGSIEKNLMEWARNSKKVVFTGLVPKKDMPKYYAAMDILVHPTYREGFGMVLQEAGAFGLGIITTNIPGASEVMEDKISCLLVEPKNDDALYETMIYLFKNKNKVFEIGESARKRTMKYFDRKIMLENQRKDYSKLLEGCYNEINLE